MNHPSILAFECSWIQETGSRDEPFIERFRIINARNLEDFRRHLAREEGVSHPEDVTLHAVHHVCVEDGFTLTDLAWRKPDHDEFPCSYCDAVAKESWARQE